MTFYKYVHVRRLAYALSNDSGFTVTAQRRNQFSESDATPRTLFDEGLTSDRREEAPRPPHQTTDTVSGSTPDATVTRGHFHMPNHSQFDSRWGPRGFSIRCYWHPASKPLKISKPRCDGLIEIKQRVCCHLDRGNRENSRISGLGMSPPSRHGKHFPSGERRVQAVSHLSTFTGLVRPELVSKR